MEYGSHLLAAREVFFPGSCWMVGHSSGGRGSGCGLDSDPNRLRLTKSQLAVR